MQKTPIYDKVVLGSGQVCHFVVVESSVFVEDVVFLKHPFLKTVLNRQISMKSSRKYGHQHRLWVLMLQVCPKQWLRLISLFFFFWFRFWFFATSNLVLRPGASPNHDYQSAASLKRFVVYFLKKDHTNCFPKIQLPPDQRKKTFRKAKAAKERNLKNERWIKNWNMVGRILIFLCWQKSTFPISRRVLVCSWPTHLWSCCRHWRLCLNLISGGADLWLLASRLGAASWLGWWQRRRAAHYIGFYRRATQCTIHAKVFHRKLRNVNKTNYLFIPWLVGVFTKMVPIDHYEPVCTNQW